MGMSFFSALFFLLTLASIIYLLAAIGCLGAFRRRRTQRAPVRPPITILKPVCGFDAALEENLLSFCLQDYPQFQVVFGVREAKDPATPVIRRLIAALPGHDLSLVIDDRLAVANRKTSNLINMLPAARHDLLVVADSDMRVGPDYLDRIAAPFADPQVGAATCLYSGTPGRGLASALGALYLSDWLLPSALLAATWREPDFCFGATMAVRRRVLAAIGGFEGFAPFPANGFHLGQRVRQAGWQVRISSYVVENVVVEPDLRSLLSRELRRARAGRACRPLGYAFSCIGNNSLSFAFLFLLASGFSAAGALLLTMAAGLRLGLHFQLRTALRVPPPSVPWLLPLRDLLCLFIWLRSHFGNEVGWRGRLQLMQRS
ncbi:MAG: bacteriohopanetetrol glucosamine biosynthesis glycosyltransferase HpnI [Desulfuromonadales bacterium]